MRLPKKNVVLFGSLSLLTDLRSLERRAFNAALRKHKINHVWSEASYHAMLRRYNRHPGLSELRALVAPERQDAVYASVEAAFRDLIDQTRLRLRPSARMILETCRRNQWKMALVTGAERATVLRVLAALFEYSPSRVFHVVTSSEICARPKPHPGLYRAAISALETRPAQCRCFETTLDGVRSARASGLDVELLVDA